MYKKILCIITTFVLCTNIVFAHPKESIKDIDEISNSLNTLFLTTLQEKNLESIKKNINLIQSELNRERNEILRFIESHENTEKIGYYSLLSVLNSYQIALLELQEFYKDNNNNKAFINAIAALNEGNSMFDVAKARL